MRTLLMLWSGFYHGWMGLAAVKNPGASPEAFKNMNSPHEKKAEASFGVSDPKGMKVLAAIRSRKDVRFAVSIFD